MSHQIEKLLGFIHDGYTRQGYIAERPRLHPALRFSYRPMLTENRYVILHQLDQIDADRKARARLEAETVMAYLVSWNLFGRQDEAIDVTVPNLLRVEPNLFLKLRNIVLGIEVGDEDPEWPEDQKSERHKASLAAALAGQGPEDREADDEKNSATE